MEYFKILVVEDNDCKYRSTEQFLRGAAEELSIGLTIERVCTLYEANQAITTPISHDGIVIDMQFPKRAGEFIEKKCGVEFIHRLNYGMHKAPRVVNTSSVDTLKTLEEAKIEVQTIVNDGRYDATDEFREFLEYVIKQKGVQDGKK